MSLRTAEQGVFDTSEPVAAHEPEAAAPPTHERTQTLISVGGIMLSEANLGLVQRNFERYHNAELSSQPSELQSVAA